LSDGIFASNNPVQRDVARLLTDDMSIILISRHPEATVNFPRLTHANGGDQLAKELLGTIESSPTSALTSGRVDVLRDHVAMDKERFLEWWRPRLGAAIGTPEETAWLNVGGHFGVPRLLHDDAAKLALRTPNECQAALRAGASPDAGSGPDQQLLRAVLDGWCTDVSTSSSSEAGALLRAMRPQWYHQLVDDFRQGPHVSTGHLWLSESDRSVRASALNRLVEIDPRYAELKRAANPRGKGQKGTTEPWQNPARVLCKLHGPSLFAAEIAIAGAASRGTRGEGSIDRDGEPFGEHIDYGTFVIAVHRRPTASWWTDMHDRFDDSLSRRTWSLALLATASLAVVAQHMEHIDACLANLTDEEFVALAAASSRLGVSQRRRRIRSEVWQHAATVGPRTKLLVSHFAADTSQLDPLDALDDDKLAELLSPTAATWPIVRATTGRILDQPDSTLLGLLSKAGLEAGVDMPDDATPLNDEHVDRLLARPGSYSASWVVSAERWRSQQHEEQPLDLEALKEEWVPKVPRL
jgi:hypothetical protein